MQKILPIVQIILSVVLMAAILLQQRGAGAGSAFGGDGANYGARRGWERTLFITTIVIAVFFLLSAAAPLLQK